MWCNNWNKYNSLKTGLALELSNLKLKCSLQFVAGLYHLRIHHADSFQIFLNLIFSAVQVKFSYFLDLLTNSESTHRKILQNFLLCVIGQFSPVPFLSWMQY